MGSTRTAVLTSAVSAYLAYHITLVCSCMGDHAAIPHHFISVFWPNNLHRLEPAHSLQLLALRRRCGTTTLYRDYSQADVKFRQPIKDLFPSLRNLTLVPPGILSHRLYQATDHRSQMSSELLDSAPKILGPLGDDRIRLMLESVLAWTRPTLSVTS